MTLSSLKCMDLQMKIDDDYDADNRAKYSNVRKTTRAFVSWLEIARGGREIEIGKERIAV